MRQGLQGGALRQLRVLRRRLPKPAMLRSDKLGPDELRGMPLARTEDHHAMQCRYTSIHERRYHCDRLDGATRARRQDVGQEKAVAARIDVYLIFLSCPPSPLR